MRLWLCRAHLEKRLAERTPDQRPADVDSLLDVALHRRDRRVDLLYSPAGSHEFSVPPTREISQKARKDGSASKTHHDIERDKATSLGNSCRPDETRQLYTPTAVQPGNVSTGRLIASPSQM